LIILNNQDKSCKKKQANSYNEILWIFLI